MTNVFMHVEPHPMTKVVGGLGSVPAHVSRG
jgi:hypothetical protein